MARATLLGTIAASTAQLPFAGYQHKKGLSDALPFGEKRALIPENINPSSYQKKNTQSILLKKMLYYEHETTKRKYSHTYHHLRK
ncbi:hypothetical protein VB735_15970 [Halotia wernerae UHCC 0503]|nr:hypothetical protein [Halotia wernerae UHCC 0503]